MTGSHDEGGWWSGIQVPNGIELSHDGYWLYVLSTTEPDYEIEGKYLFLAPDPMTLVRVAMDEINEHGFHHAKVNQARVNQSPDHVLCLYYADHSRGRELNDRYRSRDGCRSSLPMVEVRC
jgi:hypothetical protein